MILRACIPHGALLALPSIVFVDACLLQKVIVPPSPNILYSPE